MGLKNVLCLFALAIFFNSCAVQTGGPGYMQPIYYGPGIGLGTLIAVLVSWNRNKSILLAIIHGILGWLYVIYALIFPK
jgi:hypothetical protein